MTMARAPIREFPPRPRGRRAGRTRLRGALGLGLPFVLALGLALGPGPLGCASKRGPGVIHQVERGENLYRIGLAYGVDAKEIARANGIRNVRALRPGQRLFIPGAKRRVRVAPTPYASRERSEARRRAPSASGSPSSLRFRWPVRGRLSSGFGSRRGRPHEGIDIAASRGTPIYAAESGRVIHSGRMRGYGKVVIVKHPGVYRTIYAHANRLFVRRGDFVERGQKIAEVGSTGRATGPHLHFEIRQRERPRDPLAYLP